MELLSERVESQTAAPDTAAASDNTNQRPRSKDRRAVTLPEVIPATVPAEPQPENPLALLGLRVDPSRLTRPKVAIVGFTDHRKLALALPEDEFELWSINELHRYEDVKRFHRWFEIHPREDLEPDPDHLKALATFDIPVYMQQRWEDIPASLPFPKEIIEQKLDSKYFTSSPAWMLGMAIAMGAREIHLYGIDMAQDTEYAEQRNCCEYWLGVAKGAGIKTFVPRTSDLLKSVGQYGFGDSGSEFSLKLKERLGWLHDQDNQLRAQIRQIDAEYEHKSADLETQYQRTRAKLDGEYRAKREQLVINQAVATGAIEDCVYWKRSWAVSGASDGTSPSPDRSKDPRTGITNVQPATQAA